MDLIVVAFLNWELEKINLKLRKTKTFWYVEVIIYYGKIAYQ